MEVPDGSATSHLVALTTAPSVEEARTIVRALVERRLIACGTIVPGALSIYRWEGAVEHEHEVLVLLKTTRERWPALVGALPLLHSYEVPELVALPVVAGLQAYLDWVSDETAPQEPAEG